MRYATNPGQNELSKRNMDNWNNPKMNTALVVVAGQDPYYVKSLDPNEKTAYGVFQQKNVFPFLFIAPGGQKV